MHRIYLIIVCLLGSMLSVNAAGRTISGLIRDTGHQPVEMATVTLLRAADSVIVAQTSTGENGSFNFTDVPGTALLLQITHIAFASKTIEINNGTEALQVGEIMLQPVSQQLSGITVRSKKPVFTKQKDRLVVNVENSIINSSQSDLVSLISRLPGVYINRQQEIMVNGQQRALVLVNEKSTMLTRGDLLQYLNTIPVNTVRHIEIIYNPPAKYDAEGSVVINIQTDRKILSGLAGSITSTSGSSVSYGALYPRLNNGVNLSLGLEHFSMAVGYNFAYNKTLSEIGEKLTFPTSTLEQFIRYKSVPERVHNLSITTIFPFSKNQELTIGYKGAFSNGEVDQRNTIQLRTQQVLDSVVSSNSLEDVKIRQHTVNLSFRTQLDSASQLTLSGAYIGLNKNYGARFGNAIQKPGNPELAENLSSTSVTDINGFIAQADYTHTIGRNGKLDAGVKFGETRTENNVRLYRLVGNIVVPDAPRSNDFQYREKLVTPYISFSTAIKKLNLTAGVRYLNRKISGGFTDSLLSDLTTASGFFPSLSFSYPASQKLMLSLGYSRRIENPNYIDVNPFIYYVNPFTSLEGNPALIPSITNKVELSATLSDMYSFSVTAYKIKDVFTTAQFQDIVTRKQRLVPANVGDVSNLEFNFGAPFSPAKWWEVYVNTGVVYQQYTETGKKLLGYGTNKKTTFQLFTEQSFKLPGAIALDISSMLLTPTIQGQFGLNTLQSYSLGLKRNFAKNKLSVKLAVNDMFRNLRYDGTVDGAQWHSDYTNRNDARQVLVTLKYNFKTSKNRVGNARSITDDELKRLPKK